MPLWSQAPAPRHQQVLFAHTLDDAVPPDHPVRVLDQLLNQVNWSQWESHYLGNRGQPAIHPRLLAGAILYGLIKRTRSSRQLEEASRERIDFRWFLEGRTVDHTTFAKFRTRFQQELEDLNGQICAFLVESAQGRGVMEMIVDGTRIRANSDRNGAKTSETLEKWIAACRAEMDRKLAELAQEDERESRETERVQALEKEVAQLQARLEKFESAKEEADGRDARKKNIGKANAPVRVPVTDPESTVLPNKEGGFAPNYTATVAVDGETGAIVSNEVVSGDNEAKCVDKALEDCSDRLDAKPDRMLGDSGFATGEVLEKLEEQDIEAYMPAGGKPDNPAHRPDPTQPVPEADRDRLPKTGQKFSSAAFVYDPSQDCYYCPMGQTLEFKCETQYARSKTPCRQYACPGKEGCPLADQCVRGKSKKRTVHRDKYQDLRDKANQRMETESGRTIYKRRAPIVEGVFGTIKQALGIRQFSLRGLAKVRMEWSWICGAFNLRKCLKGLSETTPPLPSAPQETFSQPGEPKLTWLIAGKAA